LEGSFSGLRGKGKPGRPREKTFVVEGNLAEALRRARLACPLGSRSSPNADFALKDCAELDGQVLVDLELHAGVGSARGSTCSWASAAA
jgi:alkylation response protein AidB-like acyl-CoA dehydrogenase